MRTKGESTGQVVPVTLRPLTSRAFAGRVLVDIAGGFLPRLDTLLSRATCLPLKPGEVMAGQGLPFEHLAVVENGVLAQSVAHNGHETTLAFHERGDVAGNLFALYGDLARDPGSMRRLSNPDSAVLAQFQESAVTHARVVLLDARHMAGLASRHTEWAMLRCRLLLEQSLSHVRREQERLVRSSDERYERFVEHYPGAAAQLTQREIARYLGISEVTMCRLMSRRAARRELPHMHELDIVARSHPEIPDGAANRLD